MRTKTGTLLLASMLSLAMAPAFAQDGDEDTAVLTYSGEVMVSSGGEYVTASNGQVVLVVASGPNRVDLAKISAAVGAPVKSADGRWVRDVTGFAIGGVPPVSHIANVRIFIDADLMALDPVWAAAGTPRHVFHTGAKELARMTGGTVMDVKEG